MICGTLLPHHKYRIKKAQMEKEDGGATKWSGDGGSFGARAATDLRYPDHLALNATDSTGGQISPLSTVVAETTSTRCLCLVACPSHTVIARPSLGGYLGTPRGTETGVMRVACATVDASASLIPPK